MENLTQYVLLNNRTGDLFVATRCWVKFGPICDGKFRVILMGLDDHDGWIIEHPFLETPVFFNRHCEGKIFEVLGEL